MKKLNVLSLFDGKSCGRIALHRAGFEINKYYACEIDKYAIKIAQKNYPDTVQLGDVRDVALWEYDLPWIDLLLGGSPCQGFSFAGKQLAFDDPRSALFFEYVRVLKMIRKKNPDVKFLLENVRMKEEHEAVITEILGCEPVRINSALVSAQNRRRLYWTNIADNIPQPEDRGLLLRDILQENVVGYDISDKVLARILCESVGIFAAVVDPNKAGTLNTKNNSGQLSIDSGTTLIRCINSKNNDGVRTSQPDRIYDIYGKFPSLMAEINGRNNIMVGCTSYNGKIAESDKSNCIDANFRKGPDNHGQRTFIAILADTNSGSGDRISTLIREGVKFRRLTEIECERLQTVPDNYTESVSSTQRYKMIGNGWNIDTIVHILQYYKP